MRSKGPAQGQPVWEPNMPSIRTGRGSSGSLCDEPGAAALRRARGSTGSLCSTGSRCDEPASPAQRIKAHRAQRDASEADLLAWTLIGSPDEPRVKHTWRQRGKLGFTIERTADDRGVYVSRVSAPELQGKIRPGMLVQRVNTHPVCNSGFKRVLDLLRTVARPLTVTFTVARTPILVDGRLRRQSVDTEESFSARTELWSLAVYGVPADMGLRVHTEMGLAAKALIPSPVRESVEGIGAWASPAAISARVSGAAGSVLGAGWGLSGPSKEGLCPAAGPEQARMRLIIVFGPPGVGKSTHAAALCAELGGLELVSPGRLVQEALQSDDEQSWSVRRLFESGERIPDGLLVQLVGGRVEQAGSGVVLDGLPRTAGQLDALYEWLEQNCPQHQISVIHFKAEAPALTERALGRLEALEGNAIMHTQFRPVEEDVSDDFVLVEGPRCLCRRADDTLAGIQARLELFEQRLGEVLGGFERHQIPVIEVDASDTIDAVWASVRSLCSEKLMHI